MIKDITSRIYLLIVTTIITISNSNLAMDYDSVLTTDMSHFVSWKFKPVYYTALSLKRIHNITGDFTVGLQQTTQTPINTSHQHNPNSMATKTGHIITCLLKYSIPRTVIPFALSYLHREATNECFNRSFFTLALSALINTEIWAGFDYETLFPNPISFYLTVAAGAGTAGWLLKNGMHPRFDCRTLFPNLISFYLTLAAGVGTAYWLSKDGMHLCSKLLEKDPRLFAEIYSTQPTSREYNAQQLQKLECFSNKHLHEPEKVAKIKSMLFSKNDDLEPCFKNSPLSYSQKLQNYSLLKAAIGNENHTTVIIANEASKPFNIENCMICQEPMNDYKNLTDFSCNFHSIHQHCLDDLQENYYEGKSNPDKRRCLICTPN